MTTLTLFTPASALAQALPLRRAARRLAALGYEVTVDEGALLRQQRFGGSDVQRLATIHRVAAVAPSIAMATRGGYGLTRLLDGIDWKRLQRSVDRGTRWVGYSDITVLHLGLLAHGGAPSWAGPTGVDDFGRADDDGGLDDVTVECFNEAMTGELEAVGWRTEAGFDGLQARGLLWGGNLAMLCSLIGTPHLPPMKLLKGGILFLEDVGEHPYRIERMLLQLHQAGLIDSQHAVLLGYFTGWRAYPHDRGYGLKDAVAALRARTKVPLLTGLPFGHVPTHVSLPVGRRVRLVVDGRNVLLGWA